MTPDAATNLAKRIINTWNGGPKLPEWADALTSLNEGAAGTAFVRLRNSDEHVPSIARFIATARALHTPDPTERKPPCPDCDDTGWIEDESVNRHAGWCVAPDNCHCHAVTPCRCSVGQDRRTVHATILEQNARPT